MPLPPQSRKDPYWAPGSERLQRRTVIFQSKLHRRPETASAVTKSWIAARGSRTRQTERFALSIQLDPLLELCDDGALAGCRGEFAALSRRPDGLIVPAGRRVRGPQRVERREVAVVRECGGALGQADGLVTTLQRRFRRRRADPGEAGERLRMVGTLRNHCGELLYRAGELAAIRQQLPE